MSQARARDADTTDVDTVQARFREDGLVEIVPWRPGVRSRLGPVMEAGDQAKAFARLEGCGLRYGRLDVLRHAANVVEGALDGEGLPDWNGRAVVRCGTLADWVLVTVQGEGRRPDRMMTVPKVGLLEIGRAEDLRSGTLFGSAEALEASVAVEAVVESFWYMVDSIAAVSPVVLETGIVAVAGGTRGEPYAGLSVIPVGLTLTKGSTLSGIGFRPTLATRFPTPFTDACRVEPGRRLTFLRRRLGLPRSVDANVERALREFDGLVGATRRGRGLEPRRQARKRAATATLPPAPRAPAVPAYPTVGVELPDEVKAEFSVETAHELVARLNALWTARGLMPIHPSGFPDRGKKLGFVVKELRKALVQAAGQGAAVDRA